MCFILQLNSCLPFGLHMRLHSLIMCDFDVLCGLCRDQRQGGVTKLLQDCASPHMQGVHCTTIGPTLQ